MYTQTGGYVDQGGLMAYASDYVAFHHRAATYVDKLSEAPMQPSFPSSRRRCSNSPSTSSRRGDRADHTPPHPATGHADDPVIRRPLFRKYATVFVVLVSGTLLISGLLQTVFAYQENQSALVAIQREKAIAAADRIQAFVEGVEQQIGAAVPAPLLAVGTVTPEQRRDELLRLMRQVPAVNEVSYLDADGREQVVSRAWRPPRSAVGSTVPRSRSSQAHAAGRRRSAACTSAISRSRI